MLRPRRFTVIDEEARLQELQRYDVVDSEPEPAFDRLAELAARAAATPFACISFVDEARQWTKACFGLAVPVVPRAVSLCAAAIERGGMMLEDARMDPRFQDNPLVKSGIVFYAGVPLTTPRGLVLGMLCVGDRQPRGLTREQLDALHLLRDHVMHLLEERRELNELRRSESLRQEAVEALVATKADLQARIELRTRDLEAAHKKTQQILERIADGFVALDRQWRYVYINERAAALFGRKPAELIGKHIWTEFPEGVGQPFHLAYERALRDQVAINLVEHYQPWDRWFENRIYPSPEGLSIFFTEITERKRAQDALAESERRLREAQAVAHVGSWEWSVFKNRVVWSEELYKIYGLQHDQFDGTYEGFLSRLAPEDLEYTKGVIGDAYQHPKPFVYDHRIVRPDGEVRMLHTRAEVIIDEHGAPLRMIGTCWDITERFQAERVLQSSAVLMDSIVQSAPQALLIDTDGDKVRAWNQRFADLFSVSGELLAQRAPQVLEHVATLLTDGDKLLAHVRSIAALPDLIVTETLHLRDGRAMRCRFWPYSIGPHQGGRVWAFDPL
jgi:PAS domain S-box-containing protein